MSRKNGSNKKSFFKDVLLKIKTSKKIKALLVFEFIAIIAFGYYVFHAPISNYEISEKDFVSDIEKEDKTAEEKTILKYKGKVRRGAYKVSISYDTKELTKKKNSSNVKTKNIIKIGDDNTLNLSPESNENKTRLYQGKTKNLKIKISSQANNQIKINSIKLEEQWVYRLMQFIAVLLACVTISIIAIFYEKIRNTEHIGYKLLVVLGIIVACSPAFNASLFKGDDAPFHLARIASVGEELENGQFPVRIMSNMVSDYSYENPLFYCDIFLYIPAMLYNLMVPLYVSFQIYIILVTVATALITYYCFSKITSNKKAGAIGSALYTASWYHLVNAWQRMAIGEFTAMTFLPLVILGIYNIYKKDQIKSKDWLPLTFGMSGIIMSHVLSSEMIAFFLVLYVTINIKRFLKKERIFAIVKAAALTLLITAWFIVPFADGIVSHDLSLNYTTSAEGTASNALEPYKLLRTSPFYDGVTLSTVAPNIINLAVPIIIYWLIKTEKLSISKEQKKGIIQLTALAILSMVLITSIFPWDLLSRIPVVKTLAASLQFPWRFLSITSCLSSLLISIIICRVKKDQIANTITLIMILITIITAGNLYVAMDLTRAKTNKLSMDNDLSQEIGCGEYELAKVRNYKRTKGKINTVKGEIDITEYTKDKDSRVIGYNNNNNSKISIPLTAYKYYKVTDQENNQIAWKECDHGRICFKPNNKAGKIRVEYKTPTVWKVAEAISAVTLISLIGYFIVVRRKYAK